MRPGWQSSPPGASAGPTTIKPREVVEGALCRPGIQFRGLDFSRGHHHAPPPQPPRTWRPRGLLKGIRGSRLAPPLALCPPLDAPLSGPHALTAIAASLGRTVWPVRRGRAVARREAVIAAHGDACPRKASLGHKFETWPSRWGRGLRERGRRVRACRPSSALPSRCRHPALLPRQFWHPRRWLPFSMQHSLRSAPPASSDLTQRERASLVHSIITRKLASQLPGHCLTTVATASSCLKKHPA